jgi:thioredoxin-like negative regulator of GroEL
LNELAVDYEGRLDFATVNIARNSELAKRYEVHSTPSLVIFWHGQVLYQAMGTLPARELSSMFEAAARHRVDSATVAERQNNSKKDILCNE